MSTAEISHLFACYQPSSSIAISVWKRLEAIQSLPEAIGIDCLKRLEATGSGEKLLLLLVRCFSLPMASLGLQTASGSHRIQSLPIASGSDWIDSSCFQTVMLVDNDRIFDRCMSLFINYDFLQICAAGGNGWNGGSCTSMLAEDARDRRPSMVRDVLRIFTIHCIDAGRP